MRRPVLRFSAPPPERAKARIRADFSQRPAVWAPGGGPSTASTGQPFHGGHSREPPAARAGGTRSGRRLPGQSVSWRAGAGEVAVTWKPAEARRLQAHRPCAASPRKVRRSVQQGLMCRCSGPPAPRRAGRWPGPQPDGCTGPRWPRSCHSRLTMPQLNTGSPPDARSAKRAAQRVWF